MDYDMPRVERNEEREERIRMEIVVDAYGPEEQALSWYYYLESALGFPFRARCRSNRQVSPLRTGDRVDVVGMPDENESQREIFVLIRRNDDTLAVPLAQLQPIKSSDEKTIEAAEDWHYWVDMGYEF